jgi:hypothetical protein
MIYKKKLKFYLNNQFFIFIFKKANVFSSINKGLKEEELLKSGIEEDIKRTINVQKCKIFR